MSEADAPVNAKKTRIPLEDPEALAAFLRELLPDAGQDVIEILVGLLTRQTKEINRLAAALGELRRGRSGGESEKLGRDQLRMFALLAAAQAAGAAKPAGDAAVKADEPTSPDQQLAKNKTREKPKRKPLTERYPKLTVREQVLRVEQRTCLECGLDKVCIGHDRSELLEYVPPSFFILALLRERLACPQGCSGEVEVAPPADKPFDGGIPGPGLVAEVVERKFVDHMPINRMLQSWSRSGVDVPEGTVYGWCKRAGVAVQVVADAIRHLAIVEAHVTGVDDTTVRILDRDAPKGRVIGHMWGCVGDNRYVAYFATKTWQAVDAWKYLHHRTEGWLQGDGYAGYAPIAKGVGTALKLAGCWAHARRYFVKARDKGDKRADVFLMHIGAMYAIEEQATLDGVGPEIRLERRLAQSQPILDKLVVEINAVAAQAVPQSPLGRAITYLVNQRPLLRRFLEDGRLSLDNNAAERALRPIAAGRKGWLFIGSMDCADAAANLFTVAGTAKMHGGVNVRSYLTWLFGELGRREWTAEQARCALLPEHFAALQKAA